jgi:hypothetical protein
MAAKLTYTHKCPQVVCANCHGDAVEFVVARGQVRIAPCESLKAQGWTGPQVVDGFSQIGRYVPAEPVGYIHKDGLVTIR